MATTTVTVTATAADNDLGRWWWQQQHEVARDSNCSNVFTLPAATPKSRLVVYFSPDASIDAALPPLPLLTHRNYNQPAATASKEHKLAMQSDGMGIV